MRGVPQQPLAWTLADLQGEEQPGAGQVAMALMYRLDGRAGPAA